MSDVAALIARFDADLASLEAARANYRRVVGREPPLLHEGWASYERERRAVVRAFRGRSS